MASELFDITAPRPGLRSAVFVLLAKSQQFALPIQASLDELRAHDCCVERISFDTLIRIRCGGASEARQVRNELESSTGMYFVSAACFDDYWSDVVAMLSELESPQYSARVTFNDKEHLYRSSSVVGVKAPDFIAGSASLEFIHNIRRQFGLDAFIKPAVSGGSRGALRFPADASDVKCLQLVEESLSLGHLEPTAKLLGMPYVDGPEVSCEVGIWNGEPQVFVVHEKVSIATEFLLADRVMSSPPISDTIKAEIESLKHASDLITGLLNLEVGALHSEWRLTRDGWILLDLGVRPGAGLIPHSVLQRAGIDLRVLHFAANSLFPLSIERRSKESFHVETVIACAYLNQSFEASADTASSMLKELREPDFFASHLNYSIIEDPMYQSDIGVSLGAQAASVNIALDKVINFCDKYHLSLS